MGLIKGMEQVKDTYEAWLEARAGFKECLDMARQAVGRYTLEDIQQEFIYTYAMKVKPGGVALELGVCNGRTAVVLAHCAKKIGFEAHGIDCFVLENSPGEIKELMFKLDLPYHLHVGGTAGPVLTSKYNSRMVSWNRPIDLLIVDASHIDPWVTADLERFLPFVIPGGVAIFHDYPVREIEDDPHQDVKKAVDNETWDWDMEYYIEELMCKRKPI